MRKFIKYEIKGSYRFILGIIAIVLIASTIIQMNISRQVKMAELNQNLDMGVFGGLMLVLSILVIFGSFLVAFFHIIGSFKKELYEDRGYLTFTLPLSGNKILGSKMIVAIMWYIALGLSIFLYNLLLAIVLYGSDWIVRVKDLLSLVDTGILSVGIISIVSSLMTLTLIYFSIALGRVSVKNKKIGGLWFIIFLILNSLLGYVSIRVGEAFPYYLSLDNFKILHYYDVIAMQSIDTGVGQIVLYGPNYVANLNIMSHLTQLIVSIAAFLGTGYIIEKKIDL